MHYNTRSRGWAMQIIPLSEGAFTVDKSKQFVPFDLQNDRIDQRPAGSLLVEIQPFVVVTAKDILLFDTGLGFKNSENILQLHANLLANGINPADVTKVLLSHLHKDHAGGISEKVDSGGIQPSFENAVYYINQEEFAAAFDKGIQGYDVNNLAVLKDSPQLKLVDGNGIIDGYISYEHTGGHSPFHQVFRIKDGDNKIFFGGDVAPQYQQMKTKFVAKYDFDGKKSMELRKKWWEQGREEKWTFLFYHDIKCPLYRFGQL
ncbi:MAG: MBL fold metallo-hydrolase [Ginsengibacter sp.]